MEARAEPSPRRGLAAAVAGGGAVPLAAQPHRRAESEQADARDSDHEPRQGHDGKTVTALNLALTMAQEFQRRVLVIDTDLRRPARARAPRAARRVPASSTC